MNNLTSKEILESLSINVAMAKNCANTIQVDTMESPRMSLAEKEAQHINTQKIINACAQMQNILKDCQTFKNTPHVDE